MELFELAAADVPTLLRTRGAAAPARLRATLRLCGEAES